MQRRSAALARARATFAFAFAFAAAAAALLPARALALAAAPAFDYDVVVYGSSPAGVAAATAASTLGLSVALFEPLAMIGGMGAAGNLALNDGGQAAERTGLARTFAQLNAKAYGLADGAEVCHPESFVSEASFNAMLAHASAVRLSCRLLAAAPSADGASVASVTVSCLAGPVTARVFIDASYDADLVVALGGRVAYTAGREANTTYGEPLAGARAPGWTGVGGPRHVDALRADGSLIKYVSNASELAAPGSADDSLMAFQHRMCISGDADRVPWPKPDGYDPEDFELMRRALYANNNDSSFFSAMPPSALPGYPGPKKKYCLCCGITVGASDQPGLNKGEILLTVVSTAAGTSHGVLAVTGASLGEPGSAVTVASLAEPCLGCRGREPRRACLDHCWHEPLYWPPQARARRALSWPLRARAFAGAIAALASRHPHCNPRRTIPTTTPPQAGPRPPGSSARP